MFLCTFVHGSEKSTERTFAHVAKSPRSFAPWNFRSSFRFVELSQCSRTRSHALTLFRLEALVHRHMNTSSAVPTSSSRRRCMPSSTCPDIPRHRCNASAGAYGDGIQRPVSPACTGGTRSPPCGTAMQQADRRQASPCAPAD